MSEDDFDAVLDTNLVGAFRVAKRRIPAHAAGALRPADLHLVGRRPHRFGGAGQLRGVEGRAGRLRPDPGPRARVAGITANVVAPGFVDTAMTAGAARGAPRRDPRPGAARAGTPPRKRWRPWWPSSPATPPDTSPGRSSRWTADWAWGTERSLRTNDFWRAYAHGTARRQATADHRRADGRLDRLHVAKLAQEQGATVVLTGFGRLSLVNRIAQRLPEPPPVIELDVTNPEHLAALEGNVREHVDGLDGVLHAIAFAPGAALGATSSTPSGTTSPPRCTSRRSRSSPS